MTPNSNNDKNEEARDLDDGILDELDQIEGGLLGELEEDSRLTSGVPDAQRGDDLDFIQMSGLTSPATANGDMDDEFHDVSHADKPDTDTSRPVSFYEKGVADVDAEMTPGDEPPASSSEQHDVADEKQPSPVAGLRDIVEDLSRDEGTPPQTPDSSPPASPDEFPIPESPSEEEAPASPSTDLPSPLDEADSLGPEDEPGDFPIPESPSEEEAPASPSTDLPGPLDEADSLGPKDEPGELEEDGADQQQVSDAAPSDFEANMPPTDLSEAERLLEELESQPRDSLPSPETTDNADQEASGESDDRQESQPAEKQGDSALAHASEEEELRETNDSVYRRPHGGRSRRRKHHMDRKKKRAFRWVVVAVLAAAAIAAAYQAYVVLKPQLATPTKLLRDAARLATQGKHERAADAYLDFAASLPDHPAREDALFSAAFEFYSVQEEHPAAQRSYEKALELFDTFASEYPESSARIARAETLKGQLFFKLGRHREAIDVLRKPDLRLRDPGAALPAMRTLARAFAAIEDYDAARSAYLQAASLTDNPSPDMDYQELGNLYRNLMAHAADETARRRFAELAVEQWKQAIRIDAIDPVRKKDIRVHLEVLQDKLQSGSFANPEPPPATSDAPPLAPQGTSPQDDVPAVSAPAVSAPAAPAAAAPAATAPAALPSPIDGEGDAQAGAQQPIENPAAQEDKATQAAAPEETPSEESTLREDSEEVSEEPVEPGAPTQPGAEESVSGQQDAAE